LGYKSHDITPSAETFLWTWRASEGLLREEEVASDELLLVCVEEER
jgi:hypothetical protein